MEIAHQLRERGEEVGRLILIDTEVAPMPGLSWFRAKAKLRAFAEFPLREKLAFAWGKLPFAKMFASSGSEEDPHARDSDVYRINAEAYNTYTKRRYPGRIDEITSGINLWDGLTIFYSKNKKRLAAESSTRVRVQGDHMSLMREPMVADVAARIRELLLEGS